MCYGKKLTHDHNLFQQLLCCVWMRCLVFSSLSSSSKRLYMCWFILQASILYTCYLVTVGDFNPNVGSFHRYETSCTAEQIPSRLWPGGKEWPMLRWYPGFKGHMGQRFLCSQSQICCHNHWGQWWRSFPCSPFTQGRFMVYHIVINAKVNKPCIV